MKLIILFTLLASIVFGAPIVIHASGKFPAGKVRVGEKLVDEKTLSDMLSKAAPKRGADSEILAESPIIVLLDREGGDSLPLISRALISNNFHDFSVRLEPEKVKENKIQQR